MTSLKEYSKWIQLCSSPGSRHGYLNNTNANTFIATYETTSVLRNSQNKMGLKMKKLFVGLKSYKYNAEKDTFDTFIEIEEDPSYIRHIAFNKKDQILFVNRSKQIQSIQILSHEKKCYKQTFPYGNYFLSINNYIHIINGHNNHWIGSIENNTIKTIHNTIDSSEGKWKQNEGMAIYMSSKQCILLIGGYYDDQKPLTNEIWKYCLNSQKWTQVSVSGEFKRFDFGAVLTSNQRYIVLFGGWKYNKDTGDDEDVDDIFVLDMKDDNNWKIKQSKIKCQGTGNGLVARTGGVDSGHEILVSGFVKECFKTKEFEHLLLPPFYITTIIAKYFSAEMLHYVDVKNGEHYGIYLKHILSSLFD